MIVETKAQTGQEKYNSEAPTIEGFVASLPERYRNTPALLAIESFLEDSPKVSGLFTLTSHQVRDFCLYYHEGKEPEADWYVREFAEPICSRYDMLIRRELLEMKVVQEVLAILRLWRDELYSLQYEETKPDYAMLHSIAYSNAEREWKQKDRNWAYYSSMAESPVGREIFAREYLNLETFGDHTIKRRKVTDPARAKLINEKYKKAVWEALSREYKRYLTDLIDSGQTIYYINDDEFYQNLDESSYSISPENGWRILTRDYIDKLRVARDASNTFGLWDGDVMIRTSRNLSVKDPDYLQFLNGDEFVKLGKLNTLDEGFSEIYLHYSVKRKVMGFFSLVDQIDRWCSPAKVVERLDLSITNIEKLHLVFDYGTNVDISTRYALSKVLTYLFSIEKERFLRLELNAQNANLPNIKDVIHYLQDKSIPPLNGSVNLFNFDKNTAPTNTPKEEVAQMRFDFHFQIEVIKEGVATPRYLAFANVERKLEPLYLGSEEAEYELVPVKKVSDISGYIVIPMDLRFKLTSLS